MRPGKHARIKGFECELRLRLFQKTLENGSVSKKEAVRAMQDFYQDVCAPIFAHLALILIAGSDNIRYLYAISEAANKSAVFFEH